MSDNSTINIQLDVSGIENKLERLISCGQNTNSAISSISQAIMRGFSANQVGLKSVSQGQSNIVKLCAEVSRSVTNAIHNNTSALLHELQGLREEICKGVDVLCGRDPLEDASNAVTVISGVSSLFDKVGKSFTNSMKGKDGNSTGGNSSPILLPSGPTLLGLPAPGQTTQTKASGPILLGLPAPGQTTQTKASGTNSSASGFVSSAMGSVSDLLSSGMSTDTASAGMDTVIGQIYEMAAAWDQETTAKTASTAAGTAMNFVTAAWEGICSIATAVTAAFGAVINFLTSPIGLVIIAITAIIAVIVLLVQNWDTVSAKAQEVWSFVKSKFEEFDAFLQGVFATDWTEQFGAFGSVLNAFFANVENIWNAIKTIFNGIVTFVENVFAGNWEDAWEGIKQILSGIWEGIVAAVKAPINGIIGFINGMVSGIVSGVNAIIGVLNKLKITIPDWVPGFGGSTFGFNLQTLKAPQIPYLAKGAVLPANRPFLAVVGDQRHGTNVEAPLTTIQEAVALVMDEHISAMMAGFQALLEEQRATRQTIEGIQIGDSVIGQAADRYRSKMAVIRGGW